MALERMVDKFAGAELA
jgi:hypothetical protein